MFFFRGTNIICICYYHYANHPRKKAISMLLFFYVKKTQSVSSGHDWRIYFLSWLKPYFPSPLNNPGFFFPKKGSVYKLISSDHVASLESRTLSSNPALYALPIYSLTNRIYNSNKCFLATVAVIFECQAYDGWNLYNTLLALKKMFLQNRC